ncbi:MAG TPA: nitroreductase [Polyangiaceae bacterium]|nr:nitroreductase [Polyangiaceae bacterium]
MNDRAAAIRSAMTERTTVHDYAASPVEIDVVNRALGVALAAPNHRMTEPWRFTVVGRETREPLVAISIELKGQKSGGKVDPSTASSVRDKMLNPAWLVVVSQVRNANPSVAREDYAAIACAIQNLMLSLHADGIGTKWSTGAVATDPRSYQHLGIDAEREQIVGFVWVGLPAKPPLKVPRKLSLQAVTRYLP